MQYSIVNYSETRKVPDSRIDAECYRPDYLRMENILNRKSFSTVGELAVSVVNFGAYSLCNYIEFLDDGIPFLVTENIKHNIIDTSQLHYISESVHQILHKSHCRKGQVLLTMAGAYLGRAAVFDEDFECSSNQAIAKITLGDNAATPYFLSTYLNCRYGQAQIGRLRTVTGQPNINLGLIQAIKVPNLEDSFQTRVSSTALSGVNLYRASMDLCQQAESRLLAEFDLHNWRPGQGSVVEAAFTEVRAAERFDAEYFQPKYAEISRAVRQSNSGWLHLGQLVTMEKCVEPGSSAYRDTGVPFIRVSNLSPFGISDVNQKYISDTLYRLLIKYQPKQNEILLSKDATPGIAYHVDQPPPKMIPSGGIVRLRLKTRDIINEPVLTLILNSVIVRQQAERDAGGSIIKHWRLDQIQDTLIPIPTRETQAELTVMLEQLFQQRRASRCILDLAETAVERAIEYDEASATAWLRTEVAKVHGR